MTDFQPICRCGHAHLAHADEYNDARTERTGVSVGHCMSTLDSGKRKDGRANHMALCKCRRYEPRQQRQRLSA